MTGGHIAILTQQNPGGADIRITLRDHIGGWLEIALDRGDFSRSLATGQYAPCVLRGEIALNN